MNVLIWILILLVPIRMLGGLKQNEHGAGGVFGVLLIHVLLEYVLINHLYLLMR